MNKDRLVELFESLGGQENSGFPYVGSPVFHTAKGTPYLKKPGVAMVAKPEVNLSGVESFLDGFESKLEFPDYLLDPIDLPPTEMLAKFAGQVCYASYGPKRTSNNDAQGYFNNLIGSGHGSVLEHPNFSFLWYGVSRSLTHEMVRHRAGFGYSQLSQRYVSGKVLRFVERPEYQQDEALHQRFEQRIDRDAEEYETVSTALLSMQGQQEQILSGGTVTDRRKKVQQASRSSLPNETETHIVITGNVRALRHVLSMRGSEHAEVEIRQAAVLSFICLGLISPMLFKDFEVVNLSDGTLGLKTDYPKV